LRLIDRIFEYLHHRHLTPYAFERTCGIANGYLKKQMKGKGSVGSEILEKIGDKYRELNLTWVLTGKGKMVNEGVYATGDEPSAWSEDEQIYSPQETIKSLKEKINILENALADKEKIIRLLEKA
jgi:hypothetical protein